VRRTTRTGRTGFHRTHLSACVGAGGGALDVDLNAADQLAQVGRFGTDGPTRAATSAQTRATSF